MPTLLRSRAATPLRVKEERSRLSMGSGGSGPGRVAMGQGMTVRERIRSFVTETFFVDEFSDDEAFMRAGIIDSMGMLQNVELMKKQFGIEFLYDDLVP